jgi:NitT/TauT family transport system ATP-binding protein
MTQPELSAGPPSAAGRETKKSYQMLPNTRPGSIAGLVELLQDRGQKQDLYRIAEDLLMEVDDLLPIVEAATLLQFVKSERGDIELTPNGKAFAEADIDTRKALFRDAALAHATLLQQINNALAAKSDHTMPL